MRFSTSSQYSGSEVYWSQAITAHDVRGTSSLGNNMVGTWSAASGNSVCISLSYQRPRPADKLWENNRRILELGPSFVVIKKGEHGAVLVHEDGIAAIPAFPADHDEVVDPTGAGDSFAGGMMAHLARIERTDFEAIQESLAWGTVMASFTIGAFGLDGVRSADGPSIAARMDAFRAIGRIG